jgi:hypothetical protein
MQQPSKDQSTAHVVSSRLGYTGLQDQRAYVPAKSIGDLVGVRPVDGVSRGKAPDQAGIPVYRVEQYLDVYLPLWTPDLNRAVHLASLDLPAGTYLFLLNFALSSGTREPGQVQVFVNDSDNPSAPGPLLYYSAHCSRERVERCSETRLATLPKQTRLLLWAQNLRMTKQGASADATDDCISRAELTAIKALPMSFSIG